MLLEDFRPKSQLVTRTTPVNKPRFPVIDAHNHLGEEFGGFISFLCKTIMFATIRRHH